MIFFLIDFLDVLCRGNSETCTARIMNYLIVKKRKAGGLKVFAQRNLGLKILSVKS
jgi:hypothetical protein